MTYRVKNINEIYLSKVLNYLFTNKICFSRTETDRTVKVSFNNYLLFYHKEA